MKGNEPIEELCYGCWISCLFPSNYGKYFETQKLQFFDLLKRLLDERRVVLFPPYRYKRDDGGFDVPCKSLYGRDDIWDISSEDVIVYFEKVWPKDVMYVNDESLFLFWYEADCPGLGWVDEENKAIVAS